MKRQAYITVEEDLAYRDIAYQHNLIYSSPILSIPSFLNIEKLKKKERCEEEFELDKLDKL
jgi:hypothetical protein